MNDKYIVARIVNGFLGAAFLLPVLFYLFCLVVEPRLSLQGLAMVAIPTAFSFHLFLALETLDPSVQAAFPITKAGGLKLCHYQVTGLLDGSGS
jgi:hypothetical protein